MKIDNIDSPVYIGRLGEKGVLSIGFDVSDWLAQFPLGTFTVDFKPDYLSESFSLPPTQYRVADDVLTIDIEANITGKAGRASLGIRMLVGDSVDKRSAIIPVVIAESLPPATGVMPEPVQAWIDGATIVIGEAQTATLNANEATRIANEQELLREGAESDRRRDETGRKNAETNRIALHNKWSNPEAVATTLAPEASATAEVVIGAEKVTFNLGLPEGIQGLSAYEVWEQSNAGKTEAEYIAFLKQEALAAADIANASALAAQNNLLWRRLTTNPASFYPVPQSSLYVRASGEPIQEGTGDPSPENIRPILPWKAEGETVKVQRTGKNLFDVSNPFAVIVPGHISSGEFRTNAANAKSVIVRATPGKQYALSKVGGDRSVYGFFSTYPTGGQLALLSATIEITGVSPADTQYIVWYVASATSALPTKIQIEEGTVVTPYEPYSGEEITLTAPQDIYGGWLDNEGKGQITHGYIASYVDEAVPDGWVSSIGELSAGAQVVYPLATPIDITPTAAPLISIPQLDRITPRQNVLTASTGNVELTYAKSPIQESNEVALVIIG